MLNANAMIGTHDVLLITLDTLRYDVAATALQRGMTPTLARVLPGGQWERRHSPGSFTYAAHHAFFAGFLPTPARPGRHGRLFAARSKPVINDQPRRNRFRMHFRTVYDFNAFGILQVQCPKG